MFGKGDRREFLRTSAALSAGAVLASQFVPHQVRAKDEDWIAVLGKVKDLNEKEPALIKVQFKDADGAVVHEEKVYVRWQKQGKSGQWVVLSSICTHLKCKVDFVSDEEIFRCPCHGSEFDVDGHVTRKPAKKDLIDYSGQAYEEDGMLKLKRPPE
jgi:menaquinol-cytochrome c reductase iron-sulfur subunit